MATAYWCILIAALLPYVWVSIAKASGPRYNNRDPRGWLSKQDNPRIARANGAQLNAFEAFPAFAAGVLMAQFAGIDPGRISLFAMAFVVFRILHGMFYLSGHHYVRSLVWFAGFFCVIALMAQAALRMVAAA
jgi:uncharacterized MAPEG superfamily protein